MLNNPTFRHLRNYWLEVGEYDVHVTHYYPGTNFLITPASIDPNDEEEMEYEVYWDGEQVYEEDLGDPLLLEEIEQAIREYEDEC